MKTPSYLIAAFIAFLITASCSVDKIARFTLKNIKPAYSFNADSIPSAPDYADRDDWFLYQDEGSKEVDVFFIHPTTYQSSANWNQPLSDSINTAKTLRKSIIPQALMFDSIANIYAPRYRHATFYSFFDADSNGIKALDLALLDVKTAFEYFIAHANHDKPIIIAGHSQGSFLGIKLLKDSTIQDLIGDRLVVAYMIGWPITEDDLRELPYVFCQDSTELSCLSSWNTQKKHSPVSMRAYTGSAVVYSTNPLSWTTDAEFYSKEYNQGAYLSIGDSVVIVPHYIGAENYKGFLAIDKPNGIKKYSIRKHSGNYHIYDIAFFYKNIQNNAALRKKLYLEKNLISR